MLESDYAWLDALRQAIKRNRRDAHNRYLQLATVRPDGSPAVRTLVFRDLCDEAGELRMVTDRRSAKAEEIAGDTRAEIAWYFTHTREQFRLRGHLSIEGAEAPDQTVRRKLWEALSAAARAQFYWPDPGAPVETYAAVPMDAEEPPASFAALCLGVDEVDHLILRGDPQTRRRSRRTETGWSCEAINP